MKNEILVGAVVLVVVVAGIVLYGASRPTPAKAPGTGGVATSTQGVPFIGPYTEQTQYYQIATNYPTSTPLLSVSAGADGSATALMRSFVADTISQFKSDIGVSTLPYPGQNHPDSLSIVYLYGTSDHTVSYIFTINEDTGGAHGNTFFKTFTFDTTTGASLSLADLFTSGADYLSMLSQISRAKLPTAIGPGADITFIKDGTTPDAKNFQSFFFDSTDFVLLFPPYQVASYAQGPVTLRIPKQQLWSILKSQYH